MDPKGNILIVDDEPDFLEVVKWQLKKLDYLVETSLSGEEALEILSGRDIQVLIADIRMPGIDGIELIRQALQLKPDLQCIVITGHGGIETAVEAMKLGAISYLRKPVGVDELDVAIQKGMEKIGLIRAVRERQEKLEKANEELTKLRHQLEDRLDKAITDRKQAEDALIRVQVREAVVEVMTLSLRCWRQATKKTKIDLAEESRVWTLSLDNGGTYRTRTLDRYLRFATIPTNPRYNDVLDTGYFVLSHCPAHLQIREKLETKINELEQMLLKVS
ncbi:MAG: response regulator [Thermodesulfobacteriota bacterium]|nr:response regulator [Thermodesulfobacteriota bacterium]